MRFILYINTQTSHLSRSHPTSLSESDVLHIEENAIMACVHCIPWGSAAQQATFAILTRGWKGGGGELVVVAVVFYYFFKGSPNSLWLLTESPK